ncbi:MAG TPA: hypothetical protein VM531_11365 [Sphingomicrobium sp.]|jgi:DnaJ-class molecular chaperone|nr:hypothetical protein [Sphingomicrobium sp.]
MAKETKETQRIIRTTEKFGPCFECNGKGKILTIYTSGGEQVCLRCGGTGQLVIERTVEYSNV